MREFDPKRANAWTRTERVYDHLPFFDSAGLVLATKLAEAYAQAYDPDYEGGPPRRRDTRHLDGGC